jgi:hypothetical protein
VLLRTKPLRCAAIKKFPKIIAAKVSDMQREYRSTGRWLTGGNISFFVISVPMILCLLGAAPLAVLVKLAQVSFVGAPPTAWSVGEFVQFFAFINNLMGISDDSMPKIQFFNSLLFCEYGVRPRAPASCCCKLTERTLSAATLPCCLVPRTDGADGVPDKEEHVAAGTFYKLVAHHNADTMGFYQALVAHSQMSATKLQSMLIKDTVDLGKGAGP